MFFENWDGIFRVIVVSLLAYGSLIFVLRLSGKRTLSKWNAFDFIVTIALGSALATVITSKTVVFAEGAAALALLIALQFAITWMAVRWKAVRNTVKASATLLVSDGQMIGENMKIERVAESEILGAVRAGGIGSMSDVGAVVLESDGSFSVIQRSKLGDRTALADVARDIS